MDAFDMSEIVAGHRKNGELYHEFLRAERLSLGLYVLAAGPPTPRCPIPKMRSTTSCREMERSRWPGKTAP